MSTPQLPSHDDVRRAIAWFSGILDTSFGAQGWNSYQDFVQAACDGAGVEPEVVEVLLAQQLGFLVPADFSIAWQSDVDRRRRGRGGPGA